MGDVPHKPRWQTMNKDKLGLTLHVKREHYETIWREAQRQHLSLNAMLRRLLMLGWELYLAQGRQDVEPPVDFSDPRFAGLGKDLVFHPVRGEFIADVDYLPPTMEEIQRQCDCPSRPIPPTGGKHSPSWERYVTDDKKWLNHHRELGH